MKKFDPNQTINVPLGTDFYPEGAHTNTEEIEALFENAGLNPFTESLWELWMEKGFLTEAQFEKLEQSAQTEDTYDRFRRKG